MKRMLIVLALLAPNLVAAQTRAPGAPRAIAPGQPAPAAKPAKPAGGGFMPGANSKEPVSIDAGKLDYFDKESKLVYTRDVVAVQGETTMLACVLTLFLVKTEQPKSANGQPLPTPASTGSSPASGGTEVKRMEATGPVTIISKDQIGIGDRAVYDKVENKVYLYDHVTLTQGPNVTTGDKLIYDMNSSLAQVYNGGTAPRVHSLFVPGSSNDDADPSKKGQKPPAKKDVVIGKPDIAKLAPKCP